MLIYFVEAWSEACYVIQAAQQSNETNMIIISTEEENQCAEGHMASAGWSWDINLGNLVPVSTVASTGLSCLL